MALYNPKVNKAINNMQQCTPLEMTITAHISSVSSQGAKSAGKSPVQFSRKSHGNHNITVLTCGSITCLVRLPLWTTQIYASAFGGTCRLENGFKLFDINTTEWMPES